VSSFVVYQALTVHLGIKQADEMRDEGEEEERGGCGDYEVRKMGYVCFWVYYICGGRGGGG
jgi:hypothetical protein